MTRATRTLADEYANALRECLTGSGEAVLQKAYELGRQALVEGQSLLDLVSRHHAVLQQELQHTCPGLRDSRPFEAAQTFLAESLSTIEMAHREFQEAVSAHRLLNQRLEEEIRRVAHALHDDAGQVLVAVHLALHQVACDHPSVRDRIQEVRGQLDEVEQHLRRLSHELRPALLDDLGLLAALEDLARGVSARTGIAIEVDGDRTRRLPALVETALYRIVQEALTNAARHASPAHVWVSVSPDADGVRCRVQDDGVGFDAEAAVGKGLGLVGMRERLGAVGGRLTIRSTPGHGTQLTIHIPAGVDDADTGLAGG
jgi:signal transduction histidine kinase